MLLLLCYKQPSCRGGAVAGIGTHVQPVAAGGDSHAAAAHGDRVGDGEGASRNLSSSELLPAHDGGARLVPGAHIAQGGQAVGDGGVAGVGRKGEAAAQAV